MVAMPKSLSPETVANILLARKNGESARETAKRIGITVSSVYTVLAKNGVERRPMRSTADADDATKAAIQEAFRAGATIPEIAKQQARSTNNVRDILKSMGEKTPGRNEAAAKRHILTREQELAIIEEYYDVTKRPTITERWNLPDRYIYRILKRHAAKTDHRQYTINEAAFDLPITPEAAYWAGFLMADGFITMDEQRSPTLGLDLSIVDRDHVEAFRDFLCAEHPITTRKMETGDSCRLLVRSQRLVDAMDALGIVPGKTNHEKASDIVALNEDFWRGMFDGDGFYHAHRDKYPVVGVCGSIHIVSQWRDFWISRGASVLNASPHRSIWEARTNGKACHSIIQSLVRGSPFLARKRLTGLEMLALSERTYNENEPGT